MAADGGADFRGRVSSPGKSEGQNSEGRIRGVDAGAQSRGTELVAATSNCRTVVVAVCQGGERPVVIIRE